MRLVERLNPRVERQEVVSQKPKGWREKYHPEAILDELLTRYGEPVVRVLPYIILAAVGAGISFGLTSGTELPGAIRFGIGGAAALGLAVLIKRSGSENAIFHRNKF